MTRYKYLGPKMLENMRFSYQWGKKKKKKQHLESNWKWVLGLAYKKLTWM